MTWYEEFYAGLDRLDGSMFDRHCTPDTVVRMANHPPAEGRDAARAAIEHFWATIGGMKHTLVNVVESGDTAVLEAFVDYTRLDGSEVRIPVATSIDRRDGLIAAQRIYIDLAPLHA